MKKWYLQLPDFKPVVGIEFTGKADENAEYFHTTPTLNAERLTYALFF